MKSDASELLELVHCIYEDACTKCSADVSDLRDLMTIRSRVEREGLSFLTITLPDFCKDFESALEAGFVDSKLFRSFRKSRAIPAFLQGMLSRLFDHETGRLINEVEDSPTLVEAVRQICLAFKKVEIPCSPQRLSTALDNFVEVERANSEFQVPSHREDLFSRVASVIWNNMLGDVLPDMLVPRHGPGATAERISGNQKYVWRRWHERLEPFFPFFPNAYVLSAWEDLETLQEVTFVSVQDEDPVRVVLVPKTLKAPRVIAIEPVCMQYAQQAVLGFLYRSIESYWLTRGHVNFRNQTINQDLALDSSSTGRLATIDLSDASDRVLRSLALKMFDGNPDLRDAVEACRSTFAELPDGRKIGPLSKFASMGSALCFPVESMYFYTICVAARLEINNLPVSPGNVYNVSRDIYVYGDDILVPTDEADAVCSYLQEYNCRVNSRKSFWNGKFRESCGMDAYNGYEVTPTYIRTMPPASRQQARELISWVATAHQLFDKGYWRAASLMYCTCEKFLGPLPLVNRDSSALGRISFLGGPLKSPEWSNLGWNSSTQALFVRAFVPSPVYCCDEVDGYPALQKSLLSLEHESAHLVEELLDGWWHHEQGTRSRTQDIHHLERTALRGAVTLKRRWVSAT